MKRSIVFISLLAVLFFISALAVYFIPSLHRGVRTVATTTIAHVSSSVTEPFPSIDMSQLSPLQIKLITLVHAEYDKHPVSYDQNVSKYTQGNNEAWCADFLSWMMLQAGVSYNNPNSGSWRIPGVFTLQEYYQAQHRYGMAGIYQPKPGDVAFVHIGTDNGYTSASGHVEMVIKVSANQMTTVGGNDNGRIRINTQTIARGTNGLVGFGTL